MMSSCVRSPVPPPQVATSSHQMAAKGPRVRANSVSLPASQVNRKRTSSGIFQVDETGTLPESAEHSRPKSEGIEVNGRRREKNNPSPTQSIRKRTSSGVFQTDDLGPPPKKSEAAKPEVAKPEVTKPEVSKRNGRRKEKEASVPEQKREREDKIIDKFDSEAKSVCVNAFKESDSWD